MDILSAVGIDSTLIYQLIIFLFVYVILTHLVFKPYFLAYEERNKRTVGNQDMAERIIEESKALEQEFETKARKINEDHKTIYDDSRSKALHEHDELVNSARAKAKEVLEAAREEIHSEVLKAEKDLKNEVPTVSKHIVSKLMGKELSV